MSVHLGRRSAPARNHPIPMEHALTGPHGRAHPVMGGMDLGDTAPMSALPAPRLARRPVASGACAWMAAGAVAARLGQPLDAVALGGGMVLAVYVALVGRVDKPPATVPAPLRLLAAPPRIIGTALAKVTRGHPAAIGSLLAVALLGAALWGVVCARFGGPWWVPAAAASGHLGAVLTDCLTVGSPLAWPISKGVFGGRFLPAGRVERWLLFPLLALAALGLGVVAAGPMLPPVHVGEVSCGRR